MSKIERYSDKYYILADTDILPYQGSDIAVGEDLYAYLHEYVRSPIVKTNGGHYQVSQQRSIPSETVAVPKEYYDDPEHLLVAKNRETFDLLMSGELR